MRIEGSPIATIRWPTDASFEIIHGAEKDVRLCEYLQEFFRLLDRGGPDAVGPGFLGSDFEREQELERLAFIDREVRRPEDYDGPPPSVRIVPRGAVPELSAVTLSESNIVVYEIGMRYVRSDPYTGMAILYAYLYCGGMEDRTRSLVLHFPHISKAMWTEA